MGERQVRSPFLLQLAKNLKFQENYVIIKWEIVAAEENFNALKFDGRAAGTAVKNLTMAGAAHSQLHRKFDTRENLTDVRT